ncbi:hypothetical protein A2Z54_00515 [Candidatus Curtissbacteria bacterium RIFCSPHIGHO2_02_39_8]|nr:MAG: hypothetical protein A2Z54_00515 [Candidatus Curtissbacteria bacterium RIFCSPHIGHO2_02_39_8]
MTERIVIFGGAGNMGNRTNNEAQKQGHETKVVDPRAEIQIDPEEAIAWATVIYFSLFPKDLLEVLEKHGQKIREDQRVLDNTTIKRRIIPVLQGLDARGVSVCSIHPLARHDLPPRGQKVVVMDVGKNSKPARLFAEDFYDTSGMIIIDHSLEEHDRRMIREQLLPHLVMRTVGRVLEKLEDSPRELWDLAPANAELFFLSTWRTLIQDPKISANIIQNYLEDEDGRKIVHLLISSLQEITQAPDEEKLAAMLKQTFDALNKDNMASEMTESTTIILERMANLRIQSIRVLGPIDQPGVLHQITGVFAQNGINLTAADSHTPDGGVKFMFGQDRGTPQAAIDQTIINLREQGFQVVKVQKRK